MSSPVKSSSPSSKFVLAVVGAGNGGHVLCGLAGSNPNIEVRLLTRRPDLFRDRLVEVERPGIMGGPTVTGRISVVSSNAADIIPGSNLVIWCGPVVSTPDVLKNLAPTLKACNPKPIVGILFAQGCVHLLAKKVLGADTPFFALQNIPWLCRTVDPGRKASIVGNKVHTALATHRVDFDYLVKNFEPCLGGVKLRQLPDFASIVLNPANQIIHPARYWGIFKDWDGKPLAAESIPWLYRDFDDASAEALEGLDRELQNIKKALLFACPQLNLDAVIPLGERILTQYRSQISDSSSLKTIMATNQAYSMAKTPVRPVAGGVAPHFEHRVVQDDIPHGLVVLKDIADKLKLATPWINYLIEWHQGYMKKEYLVDGKLIGRDMAECTALTVLGGVDLIQVGYVEASARIAPSSSLSAPSAPLALSKL